MSRIETVSEDDKIYKVEGDIRIYKQFFAKDEIQNTKYYSASIQFSRWYLRRIN